VLCDADAHQAVRGTQDGARGANILAINALISTVSCAVDLARAASSAQALRATFITARLSGYGCVMREYVSCDT